MRVVTIEPSGAGGVGRYSYCLNRALCDQNTQCEILTSKRWNNPIENPLAAIHKVFDRKKTNPFRLYGLSKSLQRHADLIHWQSASHPNLLLWLMRLIPLRKRPWIYTIHNVLPHDSGEELIPLHKKLYNQMQGLIFHNRYSFDLFQTHFPDCPAEKTIIPFGDFGGFGEWEIPSNSQPDVPTVLFFGNIRPYKGLKWLIEAFKTVREAIPNARLCIVGQVLEPFDPYQAQIQRLRLNDAVDSDLRYIDDREIPGIFSQASVVVLPYERIDQSGVLFLALGLGKAVIASRVGGIPEVIQDGKTGILAPPKDPSALAEALITLLPDQKRAAELGANAALDVQSRFSWDTIAKLTIDFYQTILDKRP